MAKLVTIFGGSGFLGRHTVRAFARAASNAGYRMRVVTRSPNLCHYLPPMGQVGQIQLFKGNVTDAASVAAAVRGADIVVNLVGILSESGKQNFDAIQSEAPGTIARAARDAGVTSLIQVSAIGADALSDSHYARSKAEGEAAVRDAFPGAVILRPSLLFGPEDSFFNRFAALARLLPMLPLIGGGKTRFQPVFVGDVAKAIVTCTQDESAAGKTYELGGPGIYTFKELMQLILREIGRTRLLLPVPFALAKFQAMFLQILPGKLLTVDQVRQLARDNVVSPGALGLSDLGIVPQSVEAKVPTYLWRFRREGQYQPVISDKINAAPETR
jgi:NADH dehydrogenase